MVYSLGRLAHNLLMFKGLKVHAGVKTLHFGASNAPAIPDQPWVEPLSTTGMYALWRRL